MLMVSCDNPSHQVLFSYLLNVYVWISVEVVLRVVVVTVCVHVVLRGAAACQWCCTTRMTHSGESLLAECLPSWLLGQLVKAWIIPMSHNVKPTRLPGYRLLMPSCGNPFHADVKPTHQLSFSYFITGYVLVSAHLWYRHRRLYLVVHWSSLCMAVDDT